MAYPVYIFETYSPNNTPWQNTTKRITCNEQRAHLLFTYSVKRRHRRIRLSTSPRNGHTRERLEVLRLVVGGGACETWIAGVQASVERYGFRTLVIIARNG